MLVEIRSDAFKKNGVQREPIVFKRGLNVILGEDNGSNSIGKSTLLMIIDFVFGGDDYIYRCKEVKDAIGDHSIQFKFIFNDKLYCFSRSTNNPETVYICDESYNILSHYNITDYWDQLANLYGITPLGLTLRQCVAPYSRVYHRETLNEERPINSAFREKTQDAIFKFLKLFNRFQSIEEINNEYIRLKDDLDAIKKISDFKYVAKINQDQYEKNIKELKNLQEALRKLEEENAIGVANKDKIKSERHNALLNQIDTLESARSLRISEKNKLSVEPKKKESDFQKLISELSNFFDIKVDNIQKIESFHIQLTNVLNKEMKETIQKINESIDFLTEEINKLREEYKKLEQIENVSKAILDEHLRLNQQIEKITKENEFFVMKKDLKAKVDEKKKEMDEVTSTILKNLQDDINGLLRYLVINSLGGNNPPRISLPSIDRYFYKTPNDGGTGTQQKGLIAFDIVTLNNTVLPAIIHDSVLLKNIEDNTLGKIIKEYTKTSKQVFIAYDRASTYSEDIAKNLYDNSVIRLGGNGNELFGFSFTKKIEDDKKRLGK